MTTKGVKHVSNHERKAQTTFMMKLIITYDGSIEITIVVRLILIDKDYHYNM